MHIADPKSGNLGANAIVGERGIARARVFREDAGHEQVAVCFSVKGRSARPCTEVMNLSRLWIAGHLRLRKYNMYNEYTHFSETTAGDILARPAGFGIPGESVDGQDVRAVYATASRLVDQARSEKVRHFSCATRTVSRTSCWRCESRVLSRKQEEQRWMADRDPIKLLTDWITGQKLADKAQLDRISPKSSPRSTRPSVAVKPRIPAWTR